jgi:hypothetical protein
VDGEVERIAGFTAQIDEDPARCGWKVLFSANLGARRSAAAAEGERGALQLRFGSSFGSFVALHSPQSRKL